MEDAQTKFSTRKKAQNVTDSLNFMKNILGRDIWKEDKYQIESGNCIIRLSFLSFCKIF